MLGAVCVSTPLTLTKRRHLCFPRWTGRGSGGPEVKLPRSRGERGRAVPGSGARIPDHGLALPLHAQAASFPWMHLLLLKQLPVYYRQFRKIITLGPSTQTASVYQCGVASGGIVSNRYIFSLPVGGLAIEMGGLRRQSGTF